MITTGMLIFSMGFAFFIGGCGGQFPWIMYIALKNQKTAMMLNLNDPTGKTELFKLKYVMGSGGAKDKRVLQPTSVKGELTAMRKTAFSKIDIKVMDGDYMTLTTKNGYPLLINGIKKLDTNLHQMYMGEVTKNQELESKMSEMILELDSLKMQLGDAGKQAVNEFIKYYKDVKPFVKQSKS